MPYPLPRRNQACETPRKLACVCVTAAVLVTGAFGGPFVAAQEPQAAAEAGHAQSAVGAHEEEHEGDGGVATVARLVNFALLAGTLFYFLKSPVSSYLADRSTQLRKDQVDASEMKQSAAQQMEEIDRKLKALPGEIEALRAQGSQEIAAEEARIRSAAQAERARLLDQARREIDLQVKGAERELVSHAADLAVNVAAGRIKQTITDEDQKRLVDQYLQQLKN